MTMSGFFPLTGSPVAHQIDDMATRTLAVPEPYLVLEDDEIATRIRAAKRSLGGSLVILGHHYQRDDVIEHADIKRMLLHQKWASEGGLHLCLYAASLVDLHLHLHPMARTVQHHQFLRSGI
jgi:hypothetical protein